MSEVEFNVTETALVIDCTNPASIEFQVVGIQGKPGKDGENMTFTDTLTIDSNESQTVAATIYGGANCAVLGSDENILSVYDGVDNSAPLIDRITSGSARTTYGVSRVVNSGHLFIECAGGTPGVFTINYNIA